MILQSGVASRPPHPVVRKLQTLSAHAPRVRILVHPDVMGRCSYHMAEWLMTSHFELVGDPSLGPDDVVVDSQGLRDWLSSLTGGEALASL